MSATIHIEQPQIERQSLHWSLAARVGFRFCFIYFSLYSLSTGIFAELLKPYALIIPDPATHWPVRQIVFWTGGHILRFKVPLAYTAGGGGDLPFDWVLAFCLLVFAALLAVVWSALDRKRDHYIALHEWFRLLIRFSLIGTMLAFGVEKIFALQMGNPPLAALVQPFGTFPPQALLWSSIGAAPAYQIFAGLAEVLGGILLFSPRTTMLGALICLADMFQVFMLNVGYDVGVKLMSFHLILMALLLVAPEFRRLTNLFFLNRPAPPSTEPQLFRTRRANRIALAAQILFGIWLVGLNVSMDWRIWHTEGGGRPQPPLYGVWNIEQFSIDGLLRAPLLTDNERFRRAIFEFPWPGAIFQRMDDSFAVYGATVDVTGKTISLTKPGDKDWTANFTFQREAEDQVTLDGAMEGHKIHMQLQLFDRNKFTLVSHRFRWIRDHPGCC